MIVNDELVYPQIALPRTRTGEREHDFLLFEIN